MRQLATNERRLLIFFCAALFLAANLLAARAWMSWRTSVIREIEAAQSQIAEGNGWLEGASAIGSAREWMEAHQPQMATPDQASTGLLKVFRSSAEEAGLKVIEENLLPAAEVASGTAAALQAKLSGPFAGVTRFLFSLQSPAAWRSVPKITIRSDTEPLNVLVDMEVRQYYVPASSTGP
ncbi:MAG: hypothetical protein WCS65_13835 [Verrucomicrobiae bacterium]